MDTRVCIKHHRTLKLQILVPTLDKLFACGARHGRALCDAFLRVIQPFGRTVEEVDANGVRCLFVRSHNAQSSKFHRICMYIHGGGFVSGSASGSQVFATELSEHLGCTVFLPEYRVAPEYPFPTPLDDCFAAYKWLLQSYDPSEVIVAGDSAGANLALAMCHRIKDEMNDTRDALRPGGSISPNASHCFSSLSSVAGESPSPSSNKAVLHVGTTPSPETPQPLAMPAGILLFSPWVRLKEAYDLTRFGRRDFLTEEKVRIFEDAYLTGCTLDVQHPYLSPINGCFQGFPPSLIISSGEELFSHSCHTVRDRMSEAGVFVQHIEWDQGPHVFLLVPGVPTLVQQTCTVAMREFSRTCFEPSVFAKDENVP